MGVWIETLLNLVLPFPAGVTPYVGVWIETDVKDFIFLVVIVTPYVGVWIETITKLLSSLSSLRSLLMWECGLKP